MTLPGAFSKTDAWMIVVCLMLWRQPFMFAKLFVEHSIAQHKCACLSSYPTTFVANNQIYLDMCSFKSYREAV